DILTWRLTRPEAGAQEATETVETAQAVEASKASPVMAERPPVQPIPPAPELPSSHWDAEATLECSGAQAMTLTDLDAKLDGPAVKTAGGCRLVLKGVHLQGDPAVTASGGSSVWIIDSTLEGPTALVATGGAKVYVRGGRRIGEVRRAGVAELIIHPCASPRSSHDEHTA